MSDKLLDETCISRGSCEAELDYVLASRTFRNAPAVSKILRYICRRHLEGADDAINEWSIAIEALGRRSSFDPERDSIVRVEFRLLRKRLTDYYQSEGAERAIRIRVPKSGYVPSFVPAGEGEESSHRAASVLSEQLAAAATPALVPTVKGNGRQYLLVWTAGGLVFAGLLALGMQVRHYESLRANTAAPHNESTTVSRAGEAIRIMAGLDNPKYVDNSGQSWLGDRYVTGAATFYRPDRQIFRTLDPDTYRRGREGEFSYAIPVERRPYELHLHFAETEFGRTPNDGADGERTFDVFLNGRPLLRDFDITRDAAGANTATVKIWKNIWPAADGRVHLAFQARAGTPLLNAIELIPGAAMKPLAVKIVCARHPVCDRSGSMWDSDAYFLGGRHSDHQRIYKGDDDAELYASARYGNFNYAIPVAGGETYQATLRFSDGMYLEPGARVFDVECNGITLLRSFDIARFDKRQRGENRSSAVKMTFRGLKPNPQDKLIFNFIPVHNYASVDAIEIEAEDR